MRADHFGFSGFRRHADELAPDEQSGDQHGGDAYRDLGFSQSRGTKVVSLNSLFDRPGLYGENGYDYPDNPRRYAFFSLAALLEMH